MKTLGSLLLINVKNNKGLLILGLTSLYLYIGYIIYVYLFEIKDIAQTLQLTGFLITFGILYFILLSYQTARKNNTACNLLKSIKQGYLKVHLYSLSFLVFVILAFTSSVISCLNMYYFIINSNNEFYLESTLFLINNWLIPFLIAALIGYCVGLNTGSKFSFYYLILIWAVFSPTNIYFFTNLLSNSSFGNGFIFLKNLNLGIADIHHLFHPFYGFQLNWVKKVSYLTFLVLICLLSVSKHNLKRITKHLIIISLIIYSLIPYAAVDTSNKENFINDFIYYEKKQLIPESHLFDYQINNVKINISNFKRFSINLQMTITEIKHSQIAFTLYRGFSISKINSFTGEHLSFKQNGDYTIVQLPKDEESIILNIRYAGDGTLANPATTNYIYLPSDFSWLPINRAAHTHFVFNEHYIANSLIMEPKINYQLTYMGEKQPNYISLKKHNDMTYKGTGSGVSLILGNLTKTKVFLEREKIVYYPKSWFHYENKLVAYLIEFQKVITKYNSIFQTRYTLPNKIILLPNMTINYAYMFYQAHSSDDVLILQIDPSKFTQVVTLKDLIPYQVDQVINNRYINSPDEFADWLIFNSFLGGNLGEHFNENLASYQFKRFQQVASETYLNKEQINEFIEKSSKGG